MFLLDLFRKNQLTSQFIAAMLFQRKQTFLKHSGWFRSFRLGLPVDRTGGPIPWYTYAFIGFLDERLTSEMKVFEYGSGNSTRWWSEKVNKVVSCEHHKGWFEKMKSGLPENVNYKLIELEIDGEYAKAVLDCEMKFDLIVIDGRDRVNCAKYVPDALSEDGVVIWDNSDREKYQEGYDSLINLGFKRLDFSGMGPVGTFGWCTSVFYRQNNCLGI